MVLEVVVRLMVVVVMVMMWLMLMIRIPFELGHIVFVIVIIRNPKSHPRSCMSGGSHGVHHLALLLVKDRNAPQKAHMSCSKSTNKRSGCYQAIPNPAPHKTIRVSAC